MCARHGPGVDEFDISKFGFLTNQVKGGGAGATMAHSTAVENYLKQLYLEQQKVPGELVAMGRLATAVGVTPGTATTMVKTLHESDLVDYEPRGGVRLTDAGRKLALHVLRRHRIVETFLVNVLGLGWSEVHDEAEALEHVISDRVLEKIDKILNHPSTDPHGDPIPTALGTIEEADHADLAGCDVGGVLFIARILDQEPEFLQFLDRHGLKPGVRISISRRDEVADAITLEPEGAEAVTIGMRTASKILVQETEPAA